MKVLMVNGSRREKMCTYTALSEVAKELEARGIDTEIVFIGERAVDGQIDELVKEVAAKAKEADGFVFGAPVYYASPSGEMVAFMDRFFGVAADDLRFKPAATVASARRGGTTATLDVLDKYIEFNEMPHVTSRYWTMVHGNTPDEVRQDEEGMQVMRVLGRNMAWLLKSIEAGRVAGVEQPQAADKVLTNFIR